MGNRYHLHPHENGIYVPHGVVDLHSRYVLHWSLSNTMSAGWCVEVLKEVIDKYGVPEIFNTDQGSQFTSDEFVQVLMEHHIQDIHGWERARPR